MVCVRTQSESNNAFELFQIAASLHLGFDPTRNGTDRFAVPENLTIEPNTKSIG